MTSNELRQLFLNYFATHQHTIVPSSSLVPDNDPTLLFTNAGMVQFKDVFLGNDKRDYSRATSSQRCVRAGGKHNDLERVGYTARHHTFFEMLGNFSFGDYFKREAIQFAWEFLTIQLQIPAEKLWVSVYEDDREAEAIWLNEIKVDPHRFSRCGEADNFWSMGPTGPCGPCTEIFYDHGEHIPGGPPGSPDADGDRYIEIWNLVFMQYDRAPDGTLSNLPKPSVDTGMGLERIAAVMQGVQNNYDTDLFQPLIKETAKIAEIKDFQHFSLQVIADHIRSSSFLIMDGVLPSNEGRGYVLRRIIRRAIRHGHKLNIHEPFFYKLVLPLAQIMGAAYPGLITSQTLIEKTLHQEEEQFSTTLEQGLKLFAQITNELTGTIIPGETVFKLYDTYGFPEDLTADLAREHGLSIDATGFEACMSKQRERSRQASQFSTIYIVQDQGQPSTEFIGHETKKLLNPALSQVLAIYQDGKFVNQLKQGDKGSIILDRTPFYAEGGGQVGDQGLLRINQTTYFKVLDTIKHGNVHLHLGKLEKGELKIGDGVHAEIDSDRRTQIVLNHTATHLLHNVLHKVIGEHAQQKGSLVEPNRLRFDFSHPQPLTVDELRRIEQLVNAEIRANYPAEVHVTTQADAISQGAIGLFGEKYGSKVRVVTFGPSKELCGGTHADRTGDIGFFKITSETGIAAGIRRIEAVTGALALEYVEKQQASAQEKIQQAEERALHLEKELEKAKAKLINGFTQELRAKAKTINNISVLTTVVEGLDGKSLRQALDNLKEELGTAVIVLATEKDNRVGIVIGVTANLVDKLNARDMMKEITQKIAGKGGGKADLAEGGGKNPAGLPEAFQTITDYITQKTEVAKK